MGKSFPSVHNSRSIALEPANLPATAGVAVGGQQPPYADGTSRGEPHRSPRPPVAAVQIVDADPPDDARQLERVHDVGNIGRLPPLHVVVVDVGAQRPEHNPCGRRADVLHRKRCL